MAAFVNVYISNVTIYFIN